ncbi:hypothetical protein [Paraburkholderia unamae]|uniref:Immunity protein 51 of polymorphic toxin system n=1 Tax=Paraburkholderia unamae TaxID=219649 RepID=A0ABX5KVA1_9BURK|nr:hypothetical protein [Paraburkholderia unamae]PVX86431.1 hypothetical protein C7402_102267 [Paraburkholderia unamae]
MDTKQQTAPAAQPEVVWSADLELFNFDSLGELLDSDDFEVGQTVFFGEKAAVNPTHWVDVDIVLDALCDRAFDQVGEAASDYPDVSQEARDELETVLGAWVAKHAQPTFYAVKKITEYTITQEDIGA